MVQSLKSSKSRRCFSFSKLLIGHFKLDTAINNKFNKIARKSKRRNANRHFYFLVILHIEKYNAFVFWQKIV